MKKHIRKAVAIAAVAVIPLAGLAACSSGGTGSDKVTITFANADTSATWGDAVKGFEKANPDITVKQLNIPYAQYVATINQRMGQGGGGIDVMVVDAGGALADFASRGYLADLSDLKQSAVAAAVSEDMVTAREYKGKLYALEPWTTSQFLYFNKDLLAKAGVQEPSTDPAQPWTYEQLTEAAKKVKAADAAPYPFLFDQWDSYYQLQMVGVSAGGGNGISDSGKVDFANAGWQKALIWYHDLFTEGVSPRGITNDKNGPLFQTGKAAFMISGPWGVSVAAQGKIDFGIAPAPYFDGGKQATSTDSWGVAVSAKSKQAAAAKKFLQYLTIDATGNTQSAQVANITPTNKDSYTGYATKANATAGASSANFGDVMQYQLQHNAVHRPNVLGYSVFEPGANQMFADIRNGADPKNAAQKADDELTAQIARLK